MEKLSGESLYEPFHEWHDDYGKGANVGRYSLEHLGEKVHLLKKPEGEPERERFLKKLYNKVPDYLPSGKVDKSAVNDFIKLVAKSSSEKTGYHSSFDNDSRRASLGVFTAYLVNELCEKDKNTISIDRPWEHLCLFTPEGKEINLIVSPPPAGDETLWNIHEGRAYRMIRDDVGRYLGAYLNGGKVTVKPTPKASPIEVGLFCGRGMNAGTLTVIAQGRGKEGRYMSGGTLNINFAKSPGNHMKGGTINVEGYAGEVGLEMLGGEINCYCGASSVPEVPPKGRINVVGDIYNVKQPAALTDHYNLPKGCEYNWKFYRKDGKPICDAEIV